jgi:hypothetical protein
MFFYRNKVSLMSSKVEQEMAQGGIVREDSTVTIVQSTLVTLVTAGVLPDSSLPGPESPRKLENMH